MKEGKARGLTWDLASAKRVMGFFPDALCLAGGQFEGLPFILQPSQEFIIGSLFGWKKADGTRRFRRAYIEEGKGNGKSPLAAGIGLYCLLADGESRAEVYAAASKRDQAMVLFRDAVAMREQSPAMSARITTTGINPVWNLSDLKTGSFFKPIASEDGQSGPRPSCALCDEIHEHRDGRVVEMLERGFKFRRQPLLIMMTNAGSDRQTVCWQEHQHAVNVAAGDMDDDTTFSYVCALDEDDDPLEDPSCWQKANPLLNVTVTDEYLAGVVAQAKAIPGKLNGILRYHFCVWTDAEEAWMSRRALEGVLFDFDILAHTIGEEKDVYVGLDLSSVQDLAVEAFVIETGEMEVKRESEHGGEPVTLNLPTFDAWIEAWTPGDTLMERALRDSAPYDVWVREGWLHAPKGRIIRYDYMAAHLAAITKDFRIKWLAYDRYAFRHFEEELDALGLDVPVIEHPQGGKKRGALPDDFEVPWGEEKPQGLWMPGSLAELELVILEGRLRIKNNPVIVSACMSATLEEDPYGNRWLSKRRATNRIDAVVALAMAIGAANLKVGGHEPSIYESSEVFM